MQQQLGLFTKEQPQESTERSPIAIPIYRICLVRESTLEYYGQLRSSADTSRLLSSYLSGADREHFVVIMVDKKNQVIGINTVSIGSLDGSIVHPRETFKAAILSNAAALVLGHNHPSGNPAPSTEDLTITTRLVKAGKILGIQILDHVIIGSSSQYYSFADEGMLDVPGNNT